VSYLQAIVIALVQRVTELAPVSSLSHFAGCQPGPATDWQILLASKSISLGA
jgi:hypothetical protein